MQYVFLIRSSAGCISNTSRREAEWRIFYSQCKSVWKTHIAWARDRFYFYF